MSRKERERLMVLGRLKAGELSRVEAAEVVGVSLRQMHRLVVRWQTEGDVGLVHRARGRASARRVEEADRERALALYRSTYLGFGPTLFAEKLAERDGIWISHDTALRWLRSERLLVNGRRGRRSRRRRERRACFGAMVQMDGSPHAWFEDRGPACVLMTVIDDATGQRRGRFYDAETMWAAMDTFGRWCREFGVPQSLYVDRHGIYRNDREASLEEMREGKEPVTQFGRAMEELGVRLIKAHSPQAKGRIERSNGVCQDRLVKELRLAGIRSIEEANAWLEESSYFPKLDGKFAVEARESGDVHRPLVSDLGEVLCIKEERCVGLDGCVQWCGRVLQLRDPAGIRKVQVQERPAGILVVMGGGRRLGFEELNESGLRLLREQRKRAERKPLKNNKRTKPNSRQQIRLSPSRAMAIAVRGSTTCASPVAGLYAAPDRVKVPPRGYTGPLPPGSSTLTRSVSAEKTGHEGSGSSVARRGMG